MFLHVWLWLVLAQWINYFKKKKQCQYFLLCLPVAWLHLFVTLPCYAISDQMLLNAGTEPHPQSAAVLCSAATPPVYFNAVYFGDTDELIGVVRGAVSRQKSAMYESLSFSWYWMFYKAILYVICWKVNLTHSHSHVIWKYSGSLSGTCFVRSFVIEEHKRYTNSNYFVHPLIFSSKKIQLISLQRLNCIHLYEIPCLVAMTSRTGTAIGYVSLVL